MGTEKWGSQLHVKNVFFIYLIHSKTINPLFPRVFQLATSDGSVNRFWLFGFGNLTGEEWVSWMQLQQVNFSIPPLPNFNFESFLPIFLKFRRTFGVLHFEILSKNDPKLGKSGKINFCVQPNTQWNFPETKKNKFG